MTTAVGKLDARAKTNADGVAANLASITTLNADVDTTGSVRNTVRENAAAANYSNTASGLTATTIQGAIDENAGNIGDMDFTGTTSLASATTLTDAAKALDTAVGDLSFSSGKGTAVKTATNVTDAVKAIDADFHRAADGRIHIGANSFIFDDTNGNFSYEDGSGVEQSINFTKAPTVNGQPLATADTVNRLQNETRTGMASVAALTALQPLGIDSGKLQFALGSGFYQGESAIAAGANYYVTDNLAFNAGAAMDTSLDNHVIKAGVSVGFFKPKKASTINANKVVINAAKHTTVKASKDTVTVTPAQLKALMDRVEALEKELAKRK